jgi:hypothetical protein
MQPVDKPHQDKIGFFHRCRRAIDRRARQVQQFTLPRHSQVCALGFNLLDALRSAYFLSTSDKKSRSTISCPIVSCSLAILPSSVLACLPVSKMLAAAACSSFFHAWICGTCQ